VCVCIYIYGLRRYPVHVDDEYLESVPTGFCKGLKVRERERERARERERESLHLQRAQGACEYAVSHSFAGACTSEFAPSPLSLFLSPRASGAPCAYVCVYVPMYVCMCMCVCACVCVIPPSLPPSLSARVRCSVRIIYGWVGGWVSGWVGGWVGGVCVWGCLCV
jgi:hypothetical protein